LIRIARWPTWAWVALAVAAYVVRLDYIVGEYTLETGIALLAGAVLGPRRGMRVMAIATLVLLPLVLLPLGPGPADLGYMAGRILAAGVSGLLAALPPRRPVRRLQAPTLLVMAVVAGVSAFGYRDTTIGLQLKTYYSAVISLALMISLWYAMRLIAHPTRVLDLIAALAPYYLLGLGWVVLLLGLGTPAPPATATTARDLLFHGYTTHLPGDLLTAVAAGFLMDPKQRSRRWKLR